MVINESLNINTCNIKKRITQLLRNLIDENLYYLDINGKNILNQKQKEIIKKNMINNFNQNIDYNLYLSISKNYCVHKFNKGINVGKYCNRKIYIKNGDNIDLFCSRHNKSYNVTSRNYEKRNQCEYIKNNNIQCKHYANKNSTFCFMHHYKENKDEFHFNYNHIIKLNKLRNIYYKKIKKKK